MKRTMRSVEQAVRIVLLGAALSLPTELTPSVLRSITTPPSQTTETATSSLETSTERETTIIGMVQHKGTKVFRAPNEHAQFIPRADLHIGSTVRLKDIGDGWGEVIPGYGVFLWDLQDNVSRVYVRLSEFTALKNFEPISIYKDTKPEDKLVVVVHNGNHPEFLMFEKGRIVAYIPVCIGGAPGNSSTVQGDYHISGLRVSTDMNLGLHGVPFVAWYDRTNGKAIHGRPWADFNLLIRGCYGTAGCIGVPSYTENGRYNVPWGNEKLGFDHFVFNWVLTNIPYDPFTQAAVEVPWNRDRFYKDQTVRLLVVDSIGQLWNFASDQEGKLPQDWNAVIAQYQLVHTEGEPWIIPEKSTAGTITLQKVPKQPLPEKIQHPS